MSTIKSNYFSTNASAISTVDKAGEIKALQHISFVLPAIAAGAAATGVFRLKTPGKIHAIASWHIHKADGAARFEASQAAAMKVNTADSGRSIALTVPGGGTAVEATDVMHCLLIVGAV